MPNAIIVWGGWQGHEPERTAHLVGAMLEAEGVSVSITADLGILASPSLAQADLLVPIITGETIDRAVALGLQDAVRAGLGMAGHHCCMATTFKGSPPFRYLVGVTWVAHPGDIIDFRVRIRKPDDEIMRGIRDFDYRSEQYYLHFDPTIEVLAETTFSGEHDPVSEGVVMPVVFKRKFGLGRIYYSALGHVCSEFANPQMREILRRGLLWALRR